MKELEKYIHATFGISPEEMHLVASAFREEELAKGQFYLRKGQTGDKLSFIKSGLIRIYDLETDREVTQWIAQPAHFVCDLSSLMFNLPSKRNIVALTDVTLFTIRGEDYRNIGRYVPRWHQLEKLFIARCFTLLEDRIYSHLSLSAEDRYAALYRENPTLFEQVPLQYIASMLGMSAETLSRVRKKKNLSS